MGRGSSLSVELFVSDAVRRSYYWAMRTVTVMRIE